MNAHCMGGVKSRSFYYLYKVAGSRYRGYGLTFRRTQHRLKAQASRLVLSSLHVQLAPISEACFIHPKGLQVLFSAFSSFLLVLSASTCQPLPVHGQEAGRGMRFLMLLNFWPSSSGAPCHCRVSLPLDLLASSRLVILVFCSLAFCLQMVFLLTCEMLQRGSEMRGNVKLRGSRPLELTPCLQVTDSEGA